MSVTLTDDVRTEALFASDQRISQQPTAEVIRAAVGATVDRPGPTGCAALVAQEFGEHPTARPAGCAGPAARCAPRSPARPECWRRLSAGAGVRTAVRSPACTRT
jgi:hypothetical protein